MKYTKSNLVLRRWTVHANNDVFGISTGSKVRFIFFFITSILSLSPSIPFFFSTFCIPFFPCRSPIQSPSIMRFDARLFW